MQKDKILAIDIGGSKLLTAIIDIETDSSGQHHARLSGISKRLLTRQSGQSGVWTAILDSVKETLRKETLDFESIKVIGATIPGLADPKRGYWILAPFSGIADFPIAEMLAQYYNRPVFADNDINACAWGEKIFGVCQTVQNFIWLTISNGIGGGLVLNNKVFPGSFSGAAEIGHINIVENGNLCGCGNRGCLEVHAAGPAIARRMSHLLENRPEKALAFYQAAQTEEISAASIAQAMRNGDRLARQVYQETGHYLGRALAFASNLVNPEKIVIGGGVAGAFDLFYPELEKTFRGQVLRKVNQNVKIEKTGLGYEAGLFGAAALAWNPHWMD